LSDLGHEVRWKNREGATLIHIHRRMPLNFPPYKGAKPGGPQTERYVPPSVPRVPPQISVRRSLGVARALVGPSTSVSFTRSPAPIGAYGRPGAPAAPLSPVSQVMAVLAIPKEGAGDAGTPLVSTAGDLSMAGSRFGDEEFDNADAGEDADDEGLFVTNLLGPTPEAFGSTVPVQTSPTHGVSMNVLRTPFTNHTPGITSQHQMRISSPAIDPALSGLAEMSPASHAPQLSNTAAPASDGAAAVLAVRGYQPLSMSHQSGEGHCFPKPHASCPLAGQHRHDVSGGVYFSNVNEAMGSSTPVVGAVPSIALSRAFDKMEARLSNVNTGFSVPAVPKQGPDGGGQANPMQNSGDNFRAGESSYGQGDGQISVMANDDFEALFGRLD
jgi:hypothetical protein